MCRFNGAGKSTLAKLLTRLADPTEGELLFNGINAKEYDPATLRRHIAVLFQDIGQYKGFTITENIGVGNITNITPESIKEAAETAGAAEFIEQLPYKYDSFLGHMPGWYYTKHSTSALGDSDTESEDESEEKKEEQKKIQKNISGGQWQKIALARAFMRGSAADLLILDEPTANLDPEAEYNLFQTIKKFRKNRTTVYISHRFNTVRAADRIMVMEDGKVIEMGSHEELMRIKDGKYHRLYTLQVKGFMLDDKGGVSKDVNGVILDVKENLVKEIVASSV